VPTYQYQCTECGEALEAVQKFTDDALTECPNCSGRLRKVFSAVGVVFKGSGFYRNDSRGSSSSSSTAKSSESKSESKAESKSDSKSETKSSGTKSDSKGSAKSDSKPSAPASSGSGTSAA
jgi:putative FmdB family regulatory protein